MKVAFLLACMCAVILSKGFSVSAAAIKAPLDVISLDDITEEERKHLEYLDKQYDHWYPRPKRSGSGSGGIINALKETIGQGIKSKLGVIAQGSASAISHLSSGSSGSSKSHHDYHHYDIPETYEHKSFDFWSLKKSILNTLLQAIKAIKGGVIAVKGQLIKGSGHLITAKGKLISAKGEAITDLGKQIATAAALSPHHGHSLSEHDAYTHYGHSGHSAEYAAPSAPGPEYDYPDHHHHHHTHHEGYYQQYHGDLYYPYQFKK